MITYHRTTLDKELEEILALQKLNLFANLSNKERLEQGFVTLEHNFEILKRMNNVCAHCVAKKDGKIVGFALSMLPVFKNDIPLLIPMFKEIDVAIKNKKITSKYIAMGQVCVDKSARKQGVFRGLYAYMSAQLKSSFDTIITEVDTKNIRSSNAHKSVGFQLLKNYKANNQLWEIIRLNI